MFIYFWEREREKVCVYKRRRGRERGGQRIQSGLWADSREPDAGLKLGNHEIMTWAEAGRLTAWATQALQGGWNIKCHPEVSEEVAQLKLYPLNTNSPLSLPSAPGNHLPATLQGVLGWQREEKSLLNQGIVGAFHDDGAIRAALADGCKLRKEKKIPYIKEKVEKQSHEDGDIQVVFRKKIALSYIEVVCGI